MLSDDVTGLRLTASADLRHAHSSKRHLRALTLPVCGRVCGCLCRLARVPPVSCLLVRPLTSSCSAQSPWWTSALESKQPVHSDDVAGVRLAASADLRHTHSNEMHLHALTLSVCPTCTPLLASGLRRVPVPLSGHGGPAPRNQQPVHSEMWLHLPGQGTVCAGAGIVRLCR